MGENVKLVARPSNYTDSGPKVEEIKSVNNSLRVDTTAALYGIASGITDPLPVTNRTPLGVLASRFMEPVLQASANFSNGDQFFTDSTGFKAFRCIALAVPAGEAVIVGFSNTASDSTAIKATIDSITTITTGEWDTPDGVSNTGIITLTAAQPVSPWIYAYGTPDSAWIASTNYAVGNTVRPVSPNGYRYEVTTDSGSSGIVEPVWPTTIGNTIVDGGITWTCRGPITIKSVGLQQTGGTLTLVVIETVA